MKRLNFAIYCTKICHFEIKNIKKFLGRGIPLASRQTLLWEKGGPGWCPSASFRLAAGYGPGSGIVYRNFVDVTGFTD